MNTTITKRDLVAISAITGCVLSLFYLKGKVTELYKTYKVTKKRTNKQKQLKLDKEKFGKYLQQNQGIAKLEKQILSLSVIDLIKKLKTKELDHKQVLLAYQRKAFEVDKDLNCIVEFFYPNFSDVNLDGPLAGLPISIKDCFSYRGYDVCIGCSEFIGHPMPADCSPVTVIKQLGGVPFCKTVVPQTMMTVLSSNPIDGTVKNPVNLDRSPGVSSSGEAALIAAGGSPLGLGTDIGGSIRIPSNWCGITGFKPTYGRLTQFGFKPIATQKMIVPTWGPMAKDVKTLILLMQQVCGNDYQYNIDPAIPIMHFDNSLFCANKESIDYFSQSKKKMRIGYFCYDNCFKAVPACERVVIETKERLQKLGHELVRWDPPTIEERFPFLERYLECVGTDGGEVFIKLLKNDKCAPSIAFIMQILKIPKCLRLFGSYLLQLCGEKNISMMLRTAAGLPNVYDVWKLQLLLENNKRQFIADWQRCNFDAVICPALGCPAIPLDTNKNFVGALTYSTLWNTVNFPAGTVTVGQVNQQDIDAMKDYPRHRSFWHREVASMQDDTLGLPLSVQCVALPFREETCLRLMLDVQTAFEKR